MADAKFSQFPAVADPTNGEIVGLSAGDNARFPAAAFATAAQGLPAGGTIGQVLTKQSSTDYDDAWADATGGSGGRFWYKTATQPIVIVCTGQSNADGVEEALTDPIPVDPRVKCYQYLTDNTFVNPNTPALGYAFTTPDPAVTNQTTVCLPMVGYYGRNRGNVPVSTAVQLAEMYGRDVILLSICASGGEIEYWMEKDIGSSSTMNEYLINFWTHLKTLPELDGVIYPDIFIWGQSESNCGQKVSPPGLTLTPAEYNTKWQAVFDNLVANGVVSREITNVYLMDMVKPLLDIYKWEGTKEVARQTGNKVTFTSGVSLPWLSPDNVHFTGDGANLYGKIIAQIDAGASPVKDMLSSKVVLDVLPALGGNLDGGGFSGLGFKRMTLTGDLTTRVTAATTEGVIEISGQQTIDVASAIGDAALWYTKELNLPKGSGIFQAASLFWNQGVVNNIGAVATVNFGGLITGYHNPTYIPDAFNMNFIVSESAINSSPIFGPSTGAGLITGVHLGFQSGAQAKAGCSLSQSTRYLAANASYSNGGTITRNVGFHSQITTAAGGPTTYHYFMGVTVPTGNPTGAYGIYQVDTATNVLNNLRITALPTAVTGLASGTLWNNAGVVNVAP